MPRLSRYFRNFPPHNCACVASGFCARASDRASSRAHAHSSVPCSGPAHLVPNSSVQLRSPSLQPHPARGLPSSVHRFTNLFCHTADLWKSGSLVRHPCSWAMAASLSLSRQKCGSDFLQGQLELGAQFVPAYSLLLHGPLPWSLKENSSTFHTRLITGYPLPILAPLLCSNTFPEKPFSSPFWPSLPC